MEKSKVTIITDLLLLILSFAMLVCSMMSMKFVVNARNVILSVFDNWHTSPIEDIVPHRWKCPSEYYPMFNLNYPGPIKKGCYCPATQEVFFDSKHCSNTNCMKWSKIDEFAFQVWRGNTICLKKYDLESRTYKIIKKDEFCPTEFINCGFVNYFSDILCLQQFEDGETNECPINFVKISKSSEVLHNETIKRIKLDNSYELLYSNSQNSTDLIPIDFKVSENYPCLFKKRISNISELFPYSNMTNFDFGCDPNIPNNPYVNETYLDKRYTKLDSISEIFFYINNDIQILPKVPKWNKTKESNFSLFFRPFTMINSDCISYENQISFNLLFRQIKLYQFIIMNILMVNLIILGSFISFLSLSKVSSNFQSQLLGFFKLFYSFSFIGAYLYLTIFVYSKSELSSEIHYGHNKMECMDPTTYYLCNSIYDVNFYFDNMVRYNSILFYLSFPYCFCLIIQLLKFVRKIYLRINNYKRNNQAKEIIKEFLQK